MNLDCYLDKIILPRYDLLFKGHSREHILTVSCKIDSIAREHNLNRMYCKVAAYYHDLGLPEGRKDHEKRSALILREDSIIRRWIRSDVVEMLALAIEDHRSSSTHEPRNEYGKAISDADRDLRPETLLGRYISGALRNRMQTLHGVPVWDFESVCTVVYGELQVKFGVNGSSKLWYNLEEDLANLNRLRLLSEHPVTFNSLFHELWQMELEELRQEAN